METKTLDRQELISLKRMEGYTHVISYCPANHDRKSPWPQLFYRSAREAKLIAKEIQAQGLPAIWAGLDSQAPR